MKNFLVAFLIFVVWSIFGLWLYAIVRDSEENGVIQINNISEVKSENQINRNEIIIDTSENSKVKKRNFTVVSLSGELLYESDETFLIEKNNNKIILPTKLTDLPNVLANYLKKHLGQELCITTLYSSSEKQETPNLGIQRGNNFMTTLKILGIDQNRIAIKPVLTTAIFNQNNTISNGMNFSFKLIGKDRIANIKPTIPEKITFYPNYYFDEVIANKKLENLASKVKIVMENHPNLTINVLGHTDNIGADSENYIRGMKSADQIRWYLINNGGIDKSIVKAISKGENQPIMRDGAPASRAENARIEIVFLEK